jgi:hypothetical protein
VSVSPARPPPARRRLRAAALALALSLAAATGPSLAAAAPRASCRCERAGDRALVYLALDDLFDRELLRLVRLGLQGRIRIETSLYRRRRFWFDARRATEVREAVVTWSAEQAAFLLDGRTAGDPARLALPAYAVRPEGERLGTAYHYVEVTARLEVVTAASLGQVARWLVAGERAPATPADGPGSGEEPPASSPLSRTFVSYLAADLARIASGRCPVR